MHVRYELARIPQKGHLLTRQVAYVAGVQKGRGRYFGASPCLRETPPCTPFALLMHPKSLPFPTPATQAIRQVKNRIR